MMEMYNFFFPPITGLNQITKNPTKKNKNINQPTNLEDTNKIDNSISFSQIDTYNNNSLITFSSISFPPTSFFSSALPKPILSLLLTILFLLLIIPPSLSSCAWCCQSGNAPSQCKLAFVDDENHLKPGICCGYASDANGNKIPHCCEKNAQCFAISGQWVCIPPDTTSSAPEGPDNRVPGSSSKDNGVSPSDLIWILVFSIVGFIIFAACCTCIVRSGIQCLLKILCCPLRAFGLTNIGGDRQGSPRRRGNNNNNNNTNANDNNNRRRSNNNINNINNSDQLTPNNATNNDGIRHSDSLQPPSLTNLSTNTPITHFPYHPDHLTDHNNTGTSGNVAQRASHTAIEMTSQPQSDLIDPNGYPLNNPINNTNSLYSYNPSNSYPHRPSSPQMLSPPPLPIQQDGRSLLTGQDASLPLPERPYAQINSPYYNHSGFYPSPFYPTTAGNNYNVQNGTNNNNNLQSSNNNNINNSASTNQFTPYLSQSDAISLAARSTAYPAAGVNRTPGSGHLTQSNPEFTLASNLHPQSSTLDKASSVQQMDNVPGDRNNTTTNKSVLGTDINNKKQPNDRYARNNKKDDKKGTDTKGIINNRRNEQNIGSYDDEKYQNDDNDDSMSTYSGLDRGVVNTTTANNMANNNNRNNNNNHRTNNFRNLHINTSGANGTIGMNNENHSPPPLYESLPSINTVVATDLYSQEPLPQYNQQGRGNRGEVTPHNTDNNQQNNRTDNNNNNDSQQRSIARAQSIATAPGLDSMRTVNNTTNNNNKKKGNNNKNKR